MTMMMMLWMGQMQQVDLTLTTLVLLSNRRYVVTFFSSPLFVCFILCVCVVDAGLFFVSFCVCVVDAGLFFVSFCGCVVDAGLFFVSFCGCVVDAGLFFVSFCVCVCG